MSGSLKDRANRELKNARMLAAGAGAVIAVFAAVSLGTRGPDVDDKGCLKRPENGRELVSTVLLDFTDQRSQNFADYTEKVIRLVWDAARPHERLRILLLTDDEASPVRPVAEVCKPAQASFGNLMHNGKGKLDRLNDEASVTLNTALQKIIKQAKSTSESRRSPILSAIRYLSKDANLSWAQKSRLVLVSDFIENSSQLNFYTRRPSFADFSAAQVGRPLIQELTLSGVEITACELDAGPGLNEKSAAEVRAFWRDLFNDLAQRGSCFSSQCRDFGTPCKWSSTTH